MSALLLVTALGAAVVAEPQLPAPEVAGVDAGTASSSNGTAEWSGRTAYVLPQGRTEVGVLEPLRYGWRDGLEISTRPLLDFLMPNVALKSVWATPAGGVLSTTHTLTYPTGLFYLLKKKGTGGIIPHDTVVPVVLGLDNELSYSRAIVDGQVVTASLGLDLGGTFGRSTLPTIDLPIVFPRMAAYFHHVTGEAALGLDGAIFGPFSYAAHGRVFVMADAYSRLAVEGQGLVIWQATRDFRAQVGAIVAYSDLPFGSMWSWLSLADLIWAI